MDLTKIEIDQETLYALACRALNKGDRRSRTVEASTVLTQKVDEAARKIADASATDALPVLVATWPPYKDRKKAG